MKKQLLALSIMALISMTESSFAFTDKATSRYFNGPTITKVGTTTATVSLSKQVLDELTHEEKSSIYFEYSEPGKVCIAIYPTPEACLPKKTKLGETEAVVTGLSPNTTYNVVYKKDNTIRCITTPCPENGFESLGATFTTKSLQGDVRSETGNSSTGQVHMAQIVRSFGFRSQSDDVRVLQKILIEKGYMKGEATGYFGVLTLKAVKEFQKAEGITPTGFVGPLTRALLNAYAPRGEVSSETFEGKIGAYSTGCYVDGNCTVTVDGKVIIIASGRRDATLGSLKGVESIADLETKIGHEARVYAKKIDEGYTLYGNVNYYVLVK